jgi:NADH:ubiquinone oxidoreductase subunit 5 (subunit L)/multisubunit Na+/H+ antiporter MnhA subunit
MDTAYLHLVTNHIPIVGVPFALFLLVLGIWRKSDELKAVALLVFAILGIVTLGVYLLGEGGKDFVEHLAGISEDAIDAHETMGLISLVSVGVTALLSLLGLIFYKGFFFLKRRRSDRLLDGEVAGGEKAFLPNWLIFAVLGLAILSSGILGYTGKLGGKIRHTEFYGGAANTEEEGGKNRRGGDENKDASVEPHSETEEHAEPNTQRKDEGGGRGRGRGGRR